MIDRLQLPLMCKVYQWETVNVRLWGPTDARGTHGMEKGVLREQLWLPTSQLLIEKIFHSVQVYNRLMLLLIILGFRE